MKDIVVEQDVNPEVDKPSKKKQLDVGAGKEASAPAMDWDTPSIPLVPRGSGLFRIAKLQKTRTTTLLTQCLLLVLTLCLH